MSWRNGPFSFSFGFGGGWFGPVGYRPWGRPYVGGGFRKTSIDIDRSINVGDVHIDRSRKADVRRNVNNVYNRGDNKNRVVQRPEAKPGLARPRPEAKPAVARPAGRPNDVLTDRAGNVYRRGEAGTWEARKDQTWSAAQNLDRPVARYVQRPSAATRELKRPSTGTRDLPNRSVGAATRPQLERSHRARVHGAQRNASFQNHRARPASGRRGGGRRR